MKYVLFIVCLLASTGLQAQKKSASPKAYAESIQEADLKKHLYIVAGPEMEGRETATEGQRKAASYIEQQFRATGLIAGLPGGYQMPFPVYKDHYLSSRVRINGIEAKLDNDYQPILQFNNSGTQYFSELVVASHGIVDSAYDDYANLDVKGKLVLVLDGAPAGFKPSRTGYMNPAGSYAKILNARAKGAAAILIAGSAFPRKPMNTEGNMYYNLYRAAQSPGVYVVSDELANQLTGGAWLEMKKAGGSSRVPGKTFKANTMLSFDKRIEEMSSTNVIGVLEGSDKKDEYVVITAHYDHLGKRGDVIYYGADDDGSGTVAVMEIAEAFAKAKAAGKGPRRSIIFMAVSGEEKGLWGSEYYSTNPSVPVEKITVNLNIDMIGRIDTERKKADTLNYVYVVGDDKISSDLKPISEAVNKQFTNLVLDYKFNDPNDKERIYYRSDHYNFAKKGVPIIFYYDGMLKADYHQPTDTPDKINYPLLAKRARLVFHTAWDMANRQELLKRDIPLTELE